MDLVQSPSTEETWQWTSHWRQYYYINCQQAPDIGTPDTQTSTLYPVNTRLTCLADIQNPPETHTTAKLQSGVHATDNHQIKRNNIIVWNFSYSHSHSLNAFSYIVHAFGLWWIWWNDLGILFFTCDKWMNVNKKSMSFHTSVRHLEPTPKSDLIPNVPTPAFGSLVGSDWYFRIKINSETFPGSVKSVFGAWA